MRREGLRSPKRCQTDWSLANLAARARMERARPTPHAGDEGMTLIEVIVALLLLAIIITPAITFVIASGSAANQDRIRVQAINLATQTLESIQSNANYDGIYNNETTFQKVSYNENGGTTTQTFYVTVSYTGVGGAGGEQSLCNSNGQPSSGFLWQVTSQVDWVGDGGLLGSGRWTNPNNLVSTGVKQTTLLAPEQAGVLPPSATGELAVPVDDVNGNPFTAAAVPIVVLATWVDGGTPPSSTDQLEEQGTTTTSGPGAGCAVFNNLDPAAGWEYSAYIGTYSGTYPNGTVVPSTAVVASTNQPGIVNAGLTTAGAPESPSQPPLLTLSTGTIVVAPPFTVDTGTTVTGAGSPAALFSTQVTGCSPACPGIAPAADIPLSVQPGGDAGTTGVFDFDTGSSGTPISSFTVYPQQSGYTAWAGSSADNNPTYSAGSYGVSPTPLPPGQATITLPVYPVILTGTALTMTATDVGQTVNGAAPDAMVLNAPSGTTSKTGMPLGEFQLSPVGGGSISPQYIWVTPTTIYYGTSVQATPAGFTNPATCSVGCGSAPLGKGIAL